MAQETLGFRRGGFSPPLSLLMSAFALLIPPVCLTAYLQRLTERSSTMLDPVQNLLVYFVRKKLFINFTPNIAGFFGS